jgi:hypothetical protein
MTRILSAALTAAVLAAGLSSLAACSGSNLSFQVGNCINWSIGSDGNQVPMKVSCQQRRRLDRGVFCSIDELTCALEQ